MLIDTAAAGYVAEDIAGLAHFVEHMLFEGSEKYPDPQSYIRYKVFQFDQKVHPLGHLYGYALRHQSPRHP